MSHGHILTALKATVVAGLVFSSTFSNAFSPRQDDVTDHNWMRRIPCEIVEGPGCRQLPPWPRDLCDRWGFERWGFERCIPPKPWLIG